MKTFFVAVTVLAAALVLGACATTGPTPEEMKQIRSDISGAFNVAEFDQVAAIQYTFNAQLPQARVQRSWTWWPAENRVVYFDGTRTTEYNRNVAAGLMTKEIKEIDAMFINDQYWLLFPFRVVWDTVATVQEMDPKASVPIGRGWARWVRVSYPPRGGYTPGDVYDLYLGPNHRIIQWVYHRGGTPEPTRMSTWEAYRKFGPIILSLDRNGPEGSNFRVWFTDVVVTTTAGDKFAAGF
ncbi:MAG TPA: hypothetical protein ACFCUC_02980 [Desulfobacterales bacterium]